MKSVNRKEHARILYEGKKVPHHSCGICMAVTFGLKPSSYQSLRKGGITGAGECGAIKGGEMVIGEYLGDPDPIGAVTDNLRSGMTRYRELLADARLSPLAMIVCDHLVRDYPDFQGADRKAFCTELVVQVTDMVQKVLDEQGVHCREPLAYE